MKKVIILTQSEPFYIPKMIRLLLEKQNTDYQIVGYTMLSPNRKNKTIIHWFKERIKIYTYFELMLVGMAFTYCKISKLFLGSRSPYYSKEIFNRAGVQRIFTHDINCEEYIEKVKALTPDYIVSISCPQLFKEELIQVPNICCLNAHGTLLPRHKGVFGTWWTLFSEDKIAGSTIHKLELKLDSGPIIWQKSFKISEDDTQYSLAWKTKRDMAYGLIEIFQKDTLTEIQNDYTPSYHKAPTKELGKKFHKMGYCVIKFSDLKYMLSKKYL